MPIVRYQRREDDAEAIVDFCSDTRNRDHSGGVVSLPVMERSSPMLVALAAVGCGVATDHLASVLRAVCSGPGARPRTARAATWYPG